MGEYLNWKGGYLEGGKVEGGNGKSIKLWGDKWLPSLSCPSLQGPLVAELQEATVSSLINPATRSWDPSFLSRVFNQEEASEIQKIHLSRQPCDDALFWTFVQSGIYAAKSDITSSKLKSKGHLYQGIKFQCKQNHWGKGFGN